MRSRLRVFAIVGLIATALDLGVFRALVDRGLIAADIIALAVAAVSSYIGNRLLTFRGSPNARWVRNPGLFGATALLAGSVDLLFVVLMVEGGFLSPTPSKVIAIGLAAFVRWGAYRWILFEVVRTELAERRPRPPSEGDLRLSVVVPAFNESASIGRTIDALFEELQTAVQRDDMEIIVVDDGSTDDTVPRAIDAGARVIRQPENRGKGAAVRAGVLGSRGRVVIFTDADLAYPAALVVTILDEVESGWDVVVGSRRHQETTTLVRARLLRELGGRMVNWLTHLVLLGHFRDTQSGIKGFRGDIGRVIFERTRIDGFAFDVELFLISEQDRLSLTEVPVKVENRTASSVRLIVDTLLFFGDLVKIRRAAGWGWYQPTPAQEKVIHNYTEIAR